MQMPVHIRLSSCQFQLQVQTNTKHT